MKQTKFFALLLAVLTMTFSMVSCGGDDDEPAFGNYADYFIEVTEVSGGGMDSQESAALKSELNAEIAYYTLKGATKQEAINYFDSCMEDIAREFSSLHPAQTLRMTFALKTTDGKIAKKSTITITSSGASIN